MEERPKIMPPDLAEYAEAADRPPKAKRPSLPRRWPRRYRCLPLAVALGFVAITAAVAAGYLLGSSSAPAPGDQSAEAGFARDMQVHHAQAVEMSLIVREKSEDPALRAMAYDVITSKQQQIGQMYAWLDSWDLPQTSQRSSMAWMSGMDQTGMTTTQGVATDPGSMRLSPHGLMPGMATDDDLAQLRAASGRAAEILWLQLMIPHHKAGVMMAEAILQKTGDPQVIKLATAISTAQLAEIDQMRQLLAARHANEQTP